MSPRLKTSVGHRIYVFGRALGRVLTVLTVVSAVLAVVSAASMASAEPGTQSRYFPGARPASDGSHLTDVVSEGGRRFTMTVYSAAMNRAVTLQVIRPADTSRPRPTLYLLDGAEDGPNVGGAVRSWETQTDVVAFMADKNVNVVTVLDGRYSYYTDWNTDDPVLGRNKWTTFLTSELPPIVDSAFGASGRNAIAGVSMSATSVLMLAEATPRLYRSVGSFSGCAQTSGDPGRRFLQATVLTGLGNPWNIWGPDGAPDWAVHDPTTDVNLGKLRGTDVVITAGTGVPGSHESGSMNQAQRERQIADGGRLESQVAACTRWLADRMDALRIPVTVRLRPNGTHSWLYWQDDLHAAWPEFASSLGV